MKLNARLIILGLAFAVLIGAGIYSAVRLSTAPQQAMSASNVPAVRNVSFSLTDQNGQPVDESVFKGKWSAVFFGYTYCPDFCPLTLQHLAGAKAALGDKAENLQIIFISVDPARDTPENLKAYLNSGGFPSGVIGLTGSQAELDKVMSAFGAHAERQPEQDGGYLINHTVYVHVLDPKGKSAGLIGWGMMPDQMADYIARLMP